MVTRLPVPSISKTRLVWFPLTVSQKAPGPWIVRLSVINKAPLVSAMVPCNPGAKLITSGPGRPLASRIACRSDPGPLSARVVTTKLALV